MLKTFILAYTKCLTCDTNIRLNFVSMNTTAIMNRVEKQVINIYKRVEK